MSLKGILALSVFLGAMVLSGAARPMTSFTWSESPVIAGTDTKVTITAAPCHPVTVTLRIGSYETTGTVNEVPGFVNLKVPEGTEGGVYTITVSCPTDSDSHTSVVL
jgi:hypothetical protein